MEAVFQAGKHGGRNVGSGTQSQGAGQADRQRQGRQNLSEVVSHN
jgi:hypothetical protein